MRAHAEIDIDAISVHLKSKLLSFPGGRFNPGDEDERARYAVYALHRRAAVAAGDFNEEAKAATTQNVLGPPGSEIGTAGYYQPDSGDGARLWNLAERIPERERFSRLCRGRPELIDHVLVSHALRDSITTVTTDQTPCRRCRSTVPTVVPPITDNPGADHDHPGSDHRRVMATLLP